MTYTDLSQVLVLIMSSFPKQLHIHYYAALREQRGLSQENYCTEKVIASELYNELKEQFAFSYSIESLRIAINDEFVSWNHHLKNNDKIIFIPPVAGG